MNDFRKFIYDLNQKILNESIVLADFQRERANHYEIRMGQSGLFNTLRGMAAEEYTYHYGGNSEFQLNIGMEEPYKKKPMFRYGVAFSLQTSRNAVNPAEELEEERQRFNEFLRQYPKYFEGCKMWNYKDKEGRSEIGAVKSIRKNEFKNGRFFFVGKYFLKSYNDLTENDLQEIIGTLENFYTAYQYIQFFDDSAVVEKRVARISYNENNWVSPSGLLGKSRDEGSFERKNGYSHEEWLFDFSKLIDGYQYSFLEAFNANRGTYQGRVFDVSLFTVNSITKEKLWIGEIKNAEVIDMETSEEIIDIYKENGWWKEKKNQIKMLGFSSKKMEKWSSLTMNFRFKPEDFVPLVEPLVIDKDDKSITGHRFTVLYNFNKKPEPIALEPIEFALDEKGERKPLKRETTRNFIEKSTEIPLLHNEISEGLEKALKKRYDLVVPEAPTKNGLGTSIDMVGQLGTNYHFFEIKTYPNLLTCIRMALGQIVEYAYFPNRMVAKKMFIVSQHRANEREQKYLEHLREMTELPLYYMGFDVETGKIIQEF